MAAAHRGHPRVVRILLKSLRSQLVNSDEPGLYRPAFFSSTRTATVVVSKLLVEAGADLDAVTCRGHKPLHAATGEGRWGTVRYFIEAGANPNGCSDNGATPLFLAKADPQWFNKNQNGDIGLPLNVAAQNGQVEVVRELIQRVGIECCGGASAGCHALGLAAQWRRVDIIAILIDAGVIDTGRALHIACMFGGEASSSSSFSRGGRCGARAAKEPTSTMPSNLVAVRPWFPTFGRATRVLPESRGCSLMLGRTRLPPSDTRTMGVGFMPTTRRWVSHTVDSARRSSTRGPPRKSSCTRWRPSAAC